jgi:lipid II:glycine glycyltransferase (peptidoglycan interpeptide bridge formation enzyme)
MFCGPIVNHDVNQEQLIASLNAAMTRDRISVLTMCAEWLKPEVMAALGFRATVVETHLRPLDGGEAKVWATLHGTCRTRIRKAIKSGVTVEPATDLTIARELFGFYSDALARRGLTPSFDARYYESVLRHLGPDRVVSLRARVGDRTIGAGIYLHDDRCMYYWDAASSLDHLELSPNELLHWTAIQRAIDLRIPRFHMAGSPRPSQFTRKFGGRSVPYITYRRAYLPFADLALRAIDELRDLRLKILRKWRLRYTSFPPEVARRS